MVRTLCTTGNNEALKCTVHGASGVIAAMMAAYNIAACCFRRDRHLRVNAVVYSVLVAYELKQTLHHFNLIGSTEPGCVGESALPAKCA
jgi:hypothetical protein